MTWKNTLLQRIKNPARCLHAHAGQIYLVLCLLAVAMPWQVTAAERPNIIYILADDLGIGDIGPYGQKTLTTPHIDRLAAEGIKFTRHYAGSTVCAPSRCVLMTGLHSGHCAVRGNGPGIIPDDAMTVPKLLKQSGYHTAAIGKYGLGKPLPLNDPERKGFDYFFGYVGTSHAHNFYPADLVRNGQFVKLENSIIPGSGKDVGDYLNVEHIGTGVATKEGRKQWAPELFSQEVLTYLDERAAQKDKPFFLYYALNIPHTNNEAKKDSPLGHGMEAPTYGEFADKDWPDAEKGFAAFIRFLDNEVGGIVEKLKILGLDENTIIMFSSDNGPHQEGGHDPDFFDSNGPYRGIKRDLTDGGIRVPFIVRWPQEIKQGGLSDHVSGFQDLLPTVADLAGASTPESTDGISFAPILRGVPHTQETHEFLYWSFDERGGKSAVLQWPWKLIHLNTGIVRPGASSKQDLNKPLQIELYNLDANPAEDQNVANEHPELVTKLGQLIQQSYREPSS